MPLGNVGMYQATAEVSDSRHLGSGASEVVFYQLGTKFVDSADSVPQDTADIMYYTLAVGHHTGVIDCFEERLRCPRAVYEGFCALFEQGGQARYKLEGIMRGGEIQIDKGNLATLVPACSEVAAKLAGEGTDASEDVRAFAEGFSAMLAALVRDNAAYIMGRERIS